jgi:cytochrome P450
MALPPGSRTPALVNIARFARRPLDALRRWQARYGDVFTISMTGFGTGVYVVDPEAIREPFTGDQSDRCAGADAARRRPLPGARSPLSVQHGS